MPLYRRGFTSALQGDRRPKRADERRPSVPAQIAVLKLPTDRCTSVTSPHRWAGRPTKRPPRGYRLVQEASIGYIVGKEIRLADGVGIVFHLTRPVRPDLRVVVDGRTWAVEHVEHPDAELSMDTVTFILLAAGRIDPQRQIDAGRVTWTGNAELGDGATRDLRLTI